MFANFQNNGKANAMIIRTFVLRLLLAFIFCTHYALAIQRILNGPTNTTVRVNQVALLRCQVADQVGAVQWTKDSFGLGTDRAIPTFKQYQMTGSISDGEYNLEIQNVSVEDDGVYECQLQWGNKENPGQVSNPARLSVIAEPSDPSLGDSQDYIRANEDSPVRVSCISRYGRPAARLVWVVSMDQQANQITSYINNATDILKEVGVMPNRGQKSYEFRWSEKVEEENPGFYTITSEIDFIPSKEDDGRYLTCIALHSTYDGKFRATSTGLSVRYKPKVQVQLDENASDLREGGRAVFKCLVDSKPKHDANVLWQGMGDRLKSTGPQTAVVENLKMEDHLTQIACIAHNMVGSTRATANLTVNFAPRIMATSQSKVVHVGESVSFHCEASGNPHPRISWYRIGATNRDELLARGNVLTLDSVNTKHVGQYECIAHSKGFPPSRLSHSLHLKGPPIVQIAEPVYMSPNRVVLSCEIHSKPSPNKISWFRNGREIDYSNVDQTRFALREYSREFGVESKLTVDQVKANDYGTYNCTAWNEYGSRSSTIEVVEQTFWIKARKNALFYISQIPWFVWAIAFVLIFILLLICCIRSCCCCCCGRKNKSCCPRGDHLKPTKFSDCSDVTVRCEALDSDTQPYFTDMFTTSPPLDSSSELLHKDYVPISQNNPDFDYLPPPTYGSYYQQPYGYNNMMEFSPNDNNGNHPGSTFSGYNSPIMNQDICVPVYNSNRNNFTIRQLNVAPLEPLAEVDTPTGDNNGLLLADGRAASRVSTHV